MTLHVTVAGWLLGPPSGANRRLLAFLRHLAPRLDAGERITVLHGAGFVPPPELTGGGLGWIEVAIPPGGAWARHRAERRLLPPLLRTLRATVHDHGFLPVPTLPVPTCLVVHDTRAADGCTRWPRWLARRLLRQACRRAAAVVVPSHFTALRLQALDVARSGSVHVVPNGVELPPARPRAVAADAPLLHVGHLEPRKNVAVVLRALATLPEDRRPRLHLVGADAGAGASLRRLADRLALGPWVRLLGPLDDEALRHEYAAARAVVVPSRHEGFGLPALEALAHGCPLLVADAGALPEVAAGHAAVLPVDDASAWATAIAATATDAADAPARRRRHAANYDWDGPAAALLALWRSLHAGAAKGIAAHG